jgi:glutamine amidotransferase-like uncharacterized protein
MYQRSSNFPTQLFLLFLLAIPFIALSGMDTFTPASVATNKSITSQPLALVYRGPAGCPDCSQAVAALLERSKWNFRVEYVGPNEQLHLTAALLKTATLYAQPGGGNDLNSAYDYMKHDVSLIQNFVRSGGHYLGFCMGGYLAGATPGFKLLPGDTDEFIITKGASVKTIADTTTPIYWRGQRRTMYFQDGPYFILYHHPARLQILARYTNGKIAALVTPYGKGWVGVTGPHPEATAQWYSRYHLVAPAGLNNDLGQDLINTVMH